MARSNHTTYHTMDNDQEIPPGTYKGKWTGVIIELEGNGEVFTDRSINGIDVPVRVEVTERQIKIYLT